MNTSPTIDVVIPLYNTEEFILQALDSVVAQTLPPRKIIVVDDGSTDNSHALVEEYKAHSPIEILLIKKENGGLSSARNTGIRASDADFIAFLDADDVWISNKLEEQIKVYENTNLNKLALVYCNYDIIDTNSAIKFKNYKSPLDQKRMRGMVFKKLLERNQITSSGSGVLVKKEVFDTVGLFDENLKFGEDWDMWLRISQKFEVDFVDKILVHIRKHDQNMTSSYIKTFRNELTLYKKWLEKIDGATKAPLFWADKITFRILSKLDLLKILKETLPLDYRKKIFRPSFGSFFIYIPIFLLRQILNIFLYPHYISIISKYILRKGK